MHQRTRVVLAAGVTVALFLAIQLGALALVDPFQEAGHQAVEDPDDPANSVFYFVAILVATGVMLAAFKYDVDWLIKGLIIGVSAMLAWFVFAELFPPVVAVGPVDLLAVGGALVVGVALWVYPEWYVIDIAGVVMGAGAAALFGISFGLLPALLLLAVLAVYDAISVYGTEHMLDLAEGVMDLRIPVVLVVPTTLSFSYLETAGPDAVDHDAVEADGDGSSADLEDEPTDAGTDASPAPDERTTEPAGDDGQTEPEASGGDQAADGTRDALFIGLGDAIIPTILVASAAYFLDAGHLDVPVIALNLAALGAIVGTMAGLVVLLWMVLKGRPHAGLPLLNGGAIGGYLLGALASGLSLATALGF